MTTDRLIELYKEVRQMIPSKDKINAFEPRFTNIYSRIQMVDEIQRNIAFYEERYREIKYMNVDDQIESRKRIYSILVQLRYEHDEELEELTNNLLGLRAYIEKHYSEH